MKFPWIKNKEQESKGVRLYLSDGTEVSGRSIAWLEACVAEGKAREERIQERLYGCLEELSSRDLALRIAHAFLRQNSAPPSQAFNVTAMISKTMGGRTELAGFEHAEYDKAIYSDAIKLTTGS